MEMSPTHTTNSLQLYWGNYNDADNQYLPSSALKTCATGLADGKNRRQHLPHGNFWEYTNR
jgi:hypothetical protein